LAWRFLRHGCITGRRLAPSITARRTRTILRLWVPSRSSSSERGTTATARECLRSERHQLSPTKPCDARDLSLTAICARRSRQKCDGPWPYQTLCCWGMWGMICATKGAKSLAKLDVVRCGNVQYHATLHARTTLLHPNGVQGVAGSNPAVPIFQTIERQAVRSERSPIHTPL
jgi:hypothetical protein